MSDVTRILSAIEAGDPHAAEKLLPLIYDELRKLASQRLAREKPGQTLQATALVHEAYLRLVTPSDRESASPPSDWNCRGHFFAAAAEAMRRILVENARRKKSAKYGGDRKRVALAEADMVQADLIEAEVAGKTTPEKVLLLDEAISNLSHEDPAAAELAKLRLYAGLSVEDAAETLGIARATAFRHWTYARAWLHARLGQPGEPDE